MKKSLSIVLVCLFLAVTAMGQVTISPMSLFLDSKKRFETVLIMNTTTEPQEVKLKWQFGYPITDDQGIISMVYDDSLNQAKYSAADWIRGFPKNFVLQPGARQTIRVTIKAPRGLEDGTYWSRLVTNSSALSKDVGETVVEGIQTQINFQFNQITSVFYKHGAVTTGLELTEITNNLEDMNLVVLVDLKKKGNSPFLGTMESKIYDASGEVVKSKYVFVSIYFDGRHRMKFDISDLPKGSYNVDVTFLGNRTDIPSADIIPAKAVSRRGSFTKL
ncbi:MAG: hypothetical protein HQ507_04100 [Candidatus Marinimicrobia bacterium]|nr:hypothetical protein [Candidatus Neomarinimicrobiota bacterium]